MEDLQSISDSSDTWALHILHVGFILFPSIISASNYTENRVDAFWTPPILSAAGLCWAATDAGSRFHSELCTALPPVPPPTRAQPRPPTRTTAPQEDAVQKCAKFRQSPRNWHTHCCRETGVRRGDGGWVQSCKDGDEMCDGEEIASWTLDI